MHKVGFSFPGCKVKVEFTLVGVYTLSFAKKRILQPEEGTLAEWIVSSKIRGLDVN
jgi:hypothetical protein